MSTTAIRRCKVCKEPIKGHNGKTGVGNCTNKPMEDVETLAAVNVMNETSKVKRNVVTTMAAEAERASVDCSQEMNENNVVRLPSECLNCSFELPSFSLGKRKDAERIRVESCSDCNVDIRALIEGRRFVVCVCVEDDCETDCPCPGEITFHDSWEDGGLVENLPIFSDPLSEDDLMPKLKVVGNSWEEDRPNLLRLKPQVTAKGIRVEGEFVFSGFRVVEMVKGRKELSTMLSVNLSGIQLIFGSIYTRKGIKKKLYIEDFEAELCELYDGEEAEETGISEETNDVFN